MKEQESDSVSCAPKNTDSIGGLEIRRHAKMHVHTCLKTSLVESSYDRAAGFHAKFLEVNEDILGLFDPRWGKQ